MDLIDKGIILELAKNCRLSYQQLARQFDITVNAIKKRINKLLDLGVIQRFLIYPSLAMMDANALLGIISIDDSQDQEAFIKLVGNHPMIYAGGYLSDGSLLIYGEYIGDEGLNELTQFLRALDGVLDIEMHTIHADHGIKKELTRSEAKVLRQLKDDPRMSIADIAQNTRQTPRRVRKIINHFLGEGGTLPETFIRQKHRADIHGSTASIHFRIDWDLNAGGQTAFLTRLQWSDAQGQAYEIVEWLQNKFPEEYWYSLASASELMLFSVFVVDHLRDARHVTRALRDAPLVEYIETLIFYPIRKFSGLRETKLEEILTKAER